MTDEIDRLRADIASAHRKIAAQRAEILRMEEVIRDLKGDKAMLLRDLRRERGEA